MSKVKIDDKKYLDLLQELDELREICVKTYLCYHVSERRGLHKPVQQAWDIGQKIRTENKWEGAKYD